MKKMIVLLLILSLFAGLSAPALAVDSAETLESGYIVKLKDGSSVSLFSLGGEESFHGLVRAEDEAELDRLLESGMVEYYEPNAVVKLMSVPSDPYYGYQWNLTSIGADYAWSAALRGEGAVVAVIDSGIYAEHEDLRGVSVKAGEDLITGSSDVRDTLGHGTIVSGIIAATRDNGIGIAGIADKVSIVPLKCFERTDEADVLAVCKGIYKAVDTYGCSVICLSLGTDSNTVSLREAVDYAASKNVLVIAAVGNEGATRYFYPAAYDSVIGVGSYGKTGSVSSFSQQNDSVFVSAPGEAIYSTYIGRRGAYAYSDGTSFSTPHVAAVAAIAKSVDPGLTLSEFKRLLISTSTDAGPAGYDTGYGYGTISMPAFVDALLDGGYKSQGFTDISAHWAAGYIDYVVRKGYFDGLSDTVFDPDGGMNRAMLVTVLWRRAGSPLPELTGLAQFSDVTDPNAWYYSAVYWAAGRGIVEGDNGRFDPEGAVTREQIATILWRYAGGPAPAAASIAGYADASLISDWAVSAMTWSCAAGLMEGDGGALSPKGAATRAQVAALMERYDLYAA